MTAAGRSSGMDYAGVVLGNYMHFSMSLPQAKISDESSFKASKAKSVWHKAS